MEKSYGNLSEKGTQSPRDGTLGRKDKNITGSVWEFQCPADVKFGKKRGRSGELSRPQHRKGGAEVRGTAPTPAEQDTGNQTDPQTTHGTGKSQETRYKGKT